MKRLSNSCKVDEVDRPPAPSRVRARRTMNCELSRLAAYLHLAKCPCALRHSFGTVGQGAKWPLALRHVFGLAGHLTNLPLASLHGEASDGAEPASRLSA